MLKLFLNNLKMMSRNRQALFWSFMFPVMFTVIFGFFFGGEAKVGKVALVNNSNTEIATNFEKAMTDASFLEKVQGDTLDNYLAHLKKSEISAIVEIPENFGNMQDQGSPKQIKLIYDPANTNTAMVIKEFLDNFLTELNLSAQGASKIYTLDEEKTTTVNFNYFDFILIGMLGISLMNSSIQGIAIAMAKYRDDQILKRLTTTPLKTWKFILAEVFSRLVLNFVQVSLILAIGIYGFGAHIAGNFGLIYLFALIGAMLFQSIGFGIATMAKTTQAAEGMSITTTIPMMFLGGVFFPIDQLPAWLFNIVKFLPLSPLLKILRQVGVEAVSPFSDPNNIYIILAWIVVMLVLAIYRFRLSEE